MHLHRLTLCGIGPFAGEYVIDFDEFNDAGLFLLEGETGSGKSTIIDAIVFALYGTLAGHATSKDRLRSHYIDAKAESFVELVFSTSQGNYVVRRTPQFTRLTRTGSETTVAQTASLGRFLSPDSTQADIYVNRVTDVADEIVRVTGLTRDQFTQTVVLPQGEFASFLRAKPNDRQELLQQLFGTAVYERVQKVLEGQRKDAQKLRGDADDVIRVAIGAFAGAAGLEQTPTAALAALQSDEGDLVAAMDAVVTGLSTQVDTVAGEVAKLAALQVAARERFDLASSAVALGDEFVQLTARQAELAATAAEVAELGSLLEAAERAIPVTAALAEVAAAQAALELDQGRLVTQQERLDPVDAHLVTDEWSARLVELQAVIVALTPLVQVEAELGAARSGVEALAAQRDSTEASRAQQQRVVDDSPAVLAELEARAATLEVAAADVSLLVEQVAALTVRAEAQTKRAEVSTELSAAVAALEQALATSDSAELAAVTARQKWRAGVAVELAESLEPGQPCQVCGSTTHPTPALRSDGHVGLAEVEEREDLARRRRAEAVDATSIKQRLDQEIARLDGIVGDDAQLESTLVDTIVRLQQAQAAASELTEVRRELQQTQTRRDAALTQLAPLAAEVARLDAEYASALAALATTSIQVDEQRGEFDSIAQRVTHVSGRVQALEACVRLANQVHTATTLVSARRDTSDAALAKAGFDSIASATAAAVSDTQRATWRSTIANHRDDTLLVTNSLAHERFVGVDANAVIDVDAPRAQLDVATAAYDEAVAAHGTATATLREADAARTRVAKAFADSAEVRAKTATVIRLADLVAASNSANRANMQLVAYVLREEFERVVDAANVRLQQLSDGRFLLRRTEVKDGHLRTGLGLEVIDLDTNHTREPSSLSGGETFYTSLALALGLSDVVVARSGGIELGTLFVDEGFGSLDAQRLDDVLNVLNKLRSSGRVVGVISHVSEMKEIIAARIEVRRRESGGSSITVRP